LRSAGGLTNDDDDRRHEHEHDGILLYIINVVVVVVATPTPNTEIFVAGNTAIVSVFLFYSLSSL
jgi:hypothetical protein